MILNVAFLDVFHGDCVVATWDERDRRVCMVIDGGEKRDAARRLAAYLKHEKIELIDLLVATHIDADHVNGLVQFLKWEGNKRDGWNKGKERCIANYWGPKADPNWVAPSRKKTTQVSGPVLTEMQTMNFVIQSVAQNQELSKLVAQHITDEKNIRHPSINGMPSTDIFENVKIDVLAPDSQIPDSEIQRMALCMNNSYRKLASREAGSESTRRRLTLDDLRNILAMNSEKMARIAKRNANNQSIVLKLTPSEMCTPMSKEWSFLFTGDAEEESWEFMRETPCTREALPSKVLKVPHHGSVNGIDKESLRVVNPDYCIVLVGQKHGLPDGTTLNLIKRDEGRKLFCTERNNSGHHPGPCNKKKNCVRKGDSDFRSIRFVIDTDTGEAKIDVFIINTRLGRIEVKADEIWCPENNWSNN